MGIKCSLEKGKAILSYGWYLDIIIILLSYDCPTDLTLPALSPKVYSAAVLLSFVIYFNDYIILLFFS